MTHRRACVEQVPSLLLILADDVVERKFGGQLGTLIPKEQGSVCYTGEMCNES